MDQFERGAKGKTEAAQEVVKGGDDEMSPADMRREAAIAAKNQSSEEQPAGEPPIVVDVPLPGGVESPGLVTENQSLAPEEGTSPPLVVPPDGDDQDEDEDPDAGSDFKAGPNPASKNLTEVQAVAQEPLAVAGEEAGTRFKDDNWIEDIKYSVTEADSGQAGLLVEPVLELKSDDLDSGTSIPPVQEVIDYPDFLDVQMKADVNAVPGQSAIGDDAGLTQLDGDATTTNVMPGDNVTVFLPDQQVISGDYDNMQTGAEAAGLDGMASANAALHNDAFDLDLRDDPGVSRLVGDEIVFAREEPGIGLDAAQRIDGDPDRPIVMENATGNLTPSEQRKWDDASNTAEPQPIEPPVTGFTGFGSFDGVRQQGLVLGEDEFVQDQLLFQSPVEASPPGNNLHSDGVLEGAEPLEFIIGDMMPGNGATSPSNATDDADPGQFDDLPLEPILGQYPTGNFAEQSAANADQPLEFKATSSIDGEREADEMTTMGEHNDAALGGPDTSTRIVGLPDVPNVADGSQAPGEVDTTMHLLESLESTGDTLVDPAAGPLGMTKADIVTAISVEPDTYDQPDTTMSSLDEDDDDPFDGM